MTDHGKSQIVRLVDVMLLGPFLVLLASRTRRLTKTERVVLAGIGAATVVYNWQNYQRIKASS